MLIIINTPNDQRISKDLSVGSWLTMLATLSVFKFLPKTGNNMPISHLPGIALLAA